MMARMKLALGAALVVALALYCGCGKKKTTYVGPLNTAPEIAAVPDQAAVVNVDFTLDLTPYVSDGQDDVAALTFVVLSGGGSFTGGVYEHTFPAAGTVTVDFMVLDTGSMFALGSFDVVVSSGAKPLVADFSADVTYGPAPLDVTFTDMSTGGVMGWSWAFGDGGTSTVQNPSYQYAAAGVYSVSLTVIGTGGSDTMTKTSYIQVLGGSSGIIYVDGASTAATPDGTSWALAFPYIQSGIDAATDYDIVLVADGTYTDTTNRNLDFGGKAIAVRAYDLYGSGATTIDCEAVMDANGFYFGGGETNEAVVDGFTILNGYREGGAGIECQGSSPTIRNCTFMYGYCIDGGGIGVYFDSHPVIENCTVRYNSGSNGAGICIYSDSSAAIVNCTIDGNTVTGPSAVGGGIWVATNSSLTLLNTAITGNSATYGGGIYSEFSATTVEGCRIGTNTSGNEGGGILLTSSSLTLTDSLVDGNSAASGGGIWFYVSTVILTDSVVTGNSATSAGGGIFGDDSPLTLVMDGCSVTGNSAGSGGGGIYANYTTATLTDCFVSNNAVISYSTAAVGGGIAFYESNWSLTGCTVSGNTANSVSSDAFGGGIYADAGTPGSQSLTGCTVSGNTLQGVLASYGGGICYSGSRPATMEGCTVSQNTARLVYGGGSMVYGFGGGISTECDLTMTGVTISGNSLLGYAPSGSCLLWGGGLCTNEDGADLTATNCTITGNQLEVVQGASGCQGGGLRLRSGQTAMTGCTIADNSAATIAHEEVFAGGVYSEYYNATYVNCTFTGNSVETNGYAYGGGAYFYSLSGGQEVLDLTGCVFDGNSAEGTDGSYGGGVYFRSGTVATGCAVTDNVCDGDGGGAYFLDCDGMFLANCLITGNGADEYGGAIYSEGTSATVQLCTISANDAGDVGGGIYYTGVGPVINLYDSILWDNAAGRDGNEVYIYEQVSMNLDYCIVPSDAQDPDRFFGTGTINELGTCVNADPVFVTGPRGGYYLDPASPAVDAGSDTAANLGMDARTTDAGGALDSGAVDIGYHYEP